MHNYNVNNVRSVVVVLCSLISGYAWSCEEHKQYLTYSISSLDGLCMLLPALTGLYSAIKLCTAKALPSPAEPCSALPSPAEPFDDLVIIGVITARRLLNLKVLPSIFKPKLIGAQQHSHHQVHKRLSAAALAGWSQDAFRCVSLLVRPDRRELCNCGGGICSLLSDNECQHGKVAEDG